MSASVEPGTIWRYTAGGPGDGLFHMVTTLLPDINSGMVTTWGAPVDESKCFSASGFSFHGPIELFLKEFEPTD